jgi:hypothetical protein
MKARIALALTETNQAYANAGITTRMRLVHLEEAPYAETGNITTDRNRLSTNGDGYLDQVHTRRNQFGADIVALLVQNGGGYCGIAQAIMASQSTAFHVTARGCATGYYSFGHETGHLQGMRHDTYVDSGTTPYTYGHGYVHTGGTAAQRWRTVMAYDDRCTSLGYNCTRLQYFSNHLNTYNGAAMGVFATARNYQVANNTDLTVANFRTQVIGNPFASSFNSSSSGWSAVTGSWSLSSSAYLRSTGLANTGATVRHTGKYGDLTYTVRMRRYGTCATCSNRIIIRGNPGSLGSYNVWEPSYLFQYSNSGMYNIVYVNAAGTVTSLKPWTASGAVAMNNWNTLKVVAVGTQLKFYINNVLVYTAFNSGLRVGSVGFGFHRDAAAGTLYVDYANLSNTPTADINPNAEVDQGIELEGGTINQAP